jgi:superfamily II DNA or RNA helicase
MQNRPYQDRIIEQMRQALRDGHRRFVVCIPTGGGKTKISSDVILGAVAKGRRCSFVSHLREIIGQTVKTLEAVGIENVSVIRASDPREDRSRPVQVASIQTLARRPVMDPPPDIIFLDEGHRSTADCFRKWVFDKYPNSIIIALTATPTRNSGAPMGDLYTHLIIGTTYAELIEGGYLSAPMTYGMPLLPDLSTVRTVAGEFNADDLEKAVMKGDLLGDIVHQWLAKAEGRQTVCFAVSVQHSLAIVEAFKAMGVKAEHVDGNTPEDLRAAIIARVTSGETQVVSNVGVFCEGVDIPPLKCAILACPTKSIIKYKQTGGRILRPFGGIIPIILDHGGNFDRFGGPVHMDMDWSLSEKAKPVSTVPAMRACPVCFAMILSSLPTCPHCGAEIPAPKAAPKKERKVVPVDLALREIVQLNDVERAYVDSTIKDARRLGWHLKAVSKRFEEHFSKEVPLELKALISSAYKRDDVWRAARKVRMDRKKGGTVQRSFAGYRPTA